MVALRVAHIVGLMARFEFRRGTTAQQLADEWGLSLGYVHNLTAEASRKVRAQFTDPDALAADVVPGMLRSFRGAVEEGDARGVAALAAQLLEVGGLKVTRTELTGKGGGALQVQQTGVVILPPLDPEGSCPPVDDDDAADAVDTEPGPPDPVSGVDGV